MPSPSTRDLRTIEPGQNAVFEHILSSAKGYKSMINTNKTKREKAIEKKMEMDINADQAKYEEDRRNILRKQIKGVNRNLNVRKERVKNRRNSVHPL